MNPELPGLVGTARDDASPIWGTTDDHCSTAQFRLIALFDGRIKSIHIDMDDGTILWHFCHPNAMHVLVRMRGRLPRVC